MLKTSNKYDKFDVNELFLLLMLYNYIIQYIFFSKLCLLHDVKEAQQLTETMLGKPSTLGYTPKHPFIVVEGLDGTGL